MRTLGAIAVDPGIELCLRARQIRKYSAGQELLAKRPVKELDLARGGRTPRGGEQMVDSVLPADPVEQHLGVLGAEAAGEDLAVVRQDLLGTPWRPIASAKCEHTARLVARTIRPVHTTNLE